MNEKVELHKFSVLSTREIASGHARRKLGISYYQPKSGLIWEIHYGIRIPDSNKKLHIMNSKIYFNKLRRDTNIALYKINSRIGLLRRLATTIKNPVLRLNNIKRNIMPAFIKGNNGAGDFTEIP